MGIFDFAGSDNVDDAGGAGAPPLPPPASLPSVSAGPSPVSSPLPTPPAVPSAPADDMDPRLRAVINRLQPPAPVSPWQQALRKIAPLLGAAFAMHDNAGGAFANEWQNIDKQRQAEASQKAEEDLRLATIIHQQEMEKASVLRQKDLDKRQADAEAKTAAAAARQKSLDTYKFLNEQAANPNWVKSTLALANQDPSSLDKLSVKSPWGENIPLSQISDLGFISQDKDGKYIVKSKRPPVHKKLVDSGSMYDVMLDPDTNQEVARTYLGEQAAKTPPIDHFSDPKEGVDPKSGKGTGKFYSFDRAGAKWVSVPSPDNGGFTTKTPPGAAQDERQRKTAGQAGVDVNVALSMLDGVEQQLGPIAGRIYGQYLLGDAGSTGSATTDAKLSALRNRINVILNAAPTAISGTTRSGGATGIMAQFRKTLDSDKMSAAALRGALSDMKDALDERAGEEAAPQIVGGTYTRDAQGRLVLTK